MVNAVRRRARVTQRHISETLLEKGFVYRPILVRATPYPIRSQHPYSLRGASRVQYHLAGNVLTTGTTRKAACPFSFGSHTDLLKLRHGDQFPLF
jgi:hypothetical protein